MELCGNIEELEFMIQRVSDNFKHFTSVAQFFAMFYYIMLEIPQKGGSSFQGNWWELYIQAEPLYIGQVADVQYMP